MNIEYPFLSNFFEISGNKLHYLDEGEGPVVVLVHGNPTWSYYYRNVVKELSSFCRVIAIDHIGCGLSDKPQDYQYTLENHINNLASLLETLNVKEFSLVVHDWGGAIGFGVAAKNPEMLKSAVVLNTAAFRSTKIPFRISLCKIPVLGEFIVRGFNGFAWPATFMAVEKPLSKEVKEGLLKPYNSWANRIATHRFVQDIPLNDRHVSYNTLLKVENGLQEFIKRKIPLMILWGGKDFCFNDSFYKRWLEFFPEALTKYYEDGGHYILEDKWEEIGPEMQSFFKKIYETE